MCLKFLETEILPTKIKSPCQLHTSPLRRPLTMSKLNVGAEI
jgi:hypothetical protein